MKLKLLPDKSTTTTSNAFYLIYGASGTRKSTLASTFGELGKTLVIDADQGYHTYASCPYIKQEWRDNIEFVDFGDFADFQALYAMIEQQSYKDIIPDYDEQTSPLKYIILDTYTAMEPALWSQIAKLNGIKGGDLKGFQEKFGFTEWGMLKEYHLKYLRAMRALVNEKNISIVYVMQENLDKDELSGATFGGPRTSGKAWIEFPEVFDVVIHTTTNLQGQSVVSTLAKGKFPAKNRLTGIGKEFLTDGRTKNIITMKEVMSVR